MNAQTETKSGDLVDEDAIYRARLNQAFGYDTDELPEPDPYEGR